MTDRRSSASTGWLVAAILAAIIALPLIAAPGIPLFLHDWVWSPYAARTLWGAQFLYSAWTQPGLGNPNSAISVNPLAWGKVFLAVFVSGRASLLLYLYLSLTCGFAGVFRLAERNLGLPAIWAGAAATFFAATPFVFNKIASGQSSYWAAMAAFIWGVSFCLDAFESGRLRDAARSAVAFALASVQLQFLVFAVVAYVLAALVYRNRRGVAIAAGGILASSVLALPAIWFLALRGPEAGAFISPPYAYWIASQSSAPLDAVAMLGYSVRYAERALGESSAWLQLVRVAAVALLLLAATALVLVRNHRTALLGLMGAFGLVFVTGMYGPAAGLWLFAFEHVDSASFLRELYHGEILYALPVSILAASALAYLGSRWPAPARATAVVLAAGVGLASWSGGLGRVLAFSAQPSYREALAAALHPGESRVLFLPAQQPLASQGDTVGGNDGLDWVDAQHHSMYEYYLSPVVAYVEATLYRGDGVPAARILPRLACSAVIYRTGITSLGYGRSLGSTDRTEAALTGAFGAPDRIAPGIDLFAVSARPLVEGGRTLEVMPADLDRMMDEKVSYLDVPGSDPARYATGLFAARPDPSEGWIRRRDAPLADMSELAAPSYGVITTGAGKRLTLGHLNGSVLVWGPSGIYVDGKLFVASRPSRLTTAASSLSIVSRGPAAIFEIREVPLNTPGWGRSGAIAVTGWSHELPWEYRAQLHLSGLAAIVLRERYDSGWQLSAPGLTVERHVRADGFANGWVVDGTGTFEVRAFYAPQTGTFVLLALSFALFAATVVVAARPIRKGGAGRLRAGGR